MKSDSRDNIFATYAKIYSDLGYAVVPVVRKGKSPLVKNWASVSEAIAKVETYRQKFPNANIGLIAGKILLTERVFAFIDIDDDRLVPFVRAIAPSISGKIGSKGQTIFYQASPKLKSTKLRGPNASAPAVEIFTTTGQTVIPPSVHPNGQRYGWIGTPLQKIKPADLPLLDDSAYRILVGVLKNKNAWEIINGGPSVKAHEFMLRLTSSGIANLTENLDWLAEALNLLFDPAYTGNTKAETRAMLESASKKHLGSGSKNEDQSTASIAVELASEGCELFHDSRGRAFISIRITHAGIANLRLDSEEANNFIRRKYYNQFKKPLHSAPLTQAIDTLKAQAFYEGNRHHVAVRMGRHGDEIYVDLGREDHLLIRITPSGWNTTFDAPIKFWRPAGFGELPVPTRGGDLNGISELLQLSAQNWLLVLSFILSALRPGGPFFCLLVDGEQGSGKSILCTIIKRIIDPAVVERLPLPNSDEQLFIQANGNHLLVFDNVSGIRSEVSDALCRLSTGGGIAKRKLYTDDDIHLLHLCCAFVINGIGEYANRPDLIERAILVSLPSMAEGSRRTERMILNEVSSLLSGWLGKLYDVIATALANEGTVEDPKNIRMADAAAWLKAAEPATGVVEGSLIAAIEQSQFNSVVDRILENTLVVTLEAVIANGAFSGRVSDLFERLKDINERPDRTFPRTPAHLSNQLQRLRPAMAKVGIFARLERKSRDGRWVTVWRKGQDPSKPAPDPFRRM